MQARRRSAIDDLLHQIQKFLGTANALMERYADISEEVRAVRVSQLSHEEALRDHFEEVGRHHDQIADRLERLERLEILDRTGHGQSAEAVKIREDIQGEHLERILREELMQQVKNLEYSRLKAARFGVNVPTDLINEIEQYEEAIYRIRQELNKD